MRKLANKRPKPEIKFDRGCDTEIDYASLDEKLKTEGISQDDADYTDIKGRQVDKNEQ